MNQISNNLNSKSKEEIFNLLDFSLDLVFCLSVMHCSLGRLSDRSILASPCYLCMYLCVIIIRIGHALDNHKRRQVDEDDKEDIKMEWQLCALVIDRFVTLCIKKIPLLLLSFRFLLWIFIFATITATFR